MPAARLMINPWTMSRATAHFIRRSLLPLTNSVARNMPRTAIMGERSLRCFVRLIWKVRSEVEGVLYEDLIRRLLSRPSTACTPNHSLPKCSKRWAYRRDRFRARNKALSTLTLTVARRSRSDRQMVQRRDVHEGDASLAIVKRRGLPAR